MTVCTPYNGASIHPGAIDYSGFIHNLQSKDLGQFNEQIQKIGKA